MNVHSHAENSYAGFNLSQVLRCRTPFARAESLCGLLRGQMLWSGGKVAWGLGAVYHAQKIG
jgi:hypothetical protein